MPTSSQLNSRLAEMGATIEELASCLLSTVPNVISVPFSPEGTDNHVAAAVADIRDKLRRHQELRRLANDRQSAPDECRRSAV